MEDTPIITKPTALLKARVNAEDCSFFFTTYVS